MFHPVEKTGCFPQGGIFCTCEPILLHTGASAGSWLERAQYLASFSSLATDQLDNYLLQSRSTRRKLHDHRGKAQDSYSVEWHKLILISAEMPRIKCMGMQPYGLRRYFLLHISSLGREKKTALSNKLSEEQSYLLLHLALTEKGNHWEFKVTHQECNMVFVHLYWNFYRSIDITCVYTHYQTCICISILKKTYH